MIKNIVGRLAEQRELERIYNSDQSEFVAVCGRRRVGKTFLVKEFFDKRLCFAVTGLANENQKGQLKNFQLTILRQFPQLGDSRKGKKRIGDWLDAFDLLIDALSSLKKRRKVILIDEMPWMDTVRSGFIPALEHFWNGWAALRRDIVLIVCGSATSWMMNKLINSHGGLHNRLTSRIFLRQFTLGETREMLEKRGFNMSDYEIAVCYMIMGGIPFYLSMLLPELSLSQNIDALLFAENGYLKLEFDNLYSALFRNSHKYISVVKALWEQRGGLSRKELEAATEMSSGGVFSEILENLEYCGFIRHYGSIDEKRKGTVYQLTDFFTLFFFHFLNGRHKKGVGYWQALQGTPAFYAWAGLSFELLALQHIEQIKAKLGISGILTEEYAWRSGADAHGVQIDLVIDRMDKTVNICEMKFSEAHYEITSEEDMKLRNRLRLFRENCCSPSKSLQLTLVTTHSLAKNKYNSVFQQVILLEDLFK